MPMPSQSNAAILVLGESHSTAIARALERAKTDEVQAIDVRTAIDGARAGPDAFADYHPQHLILAFGGTEYNIVGLIEADPGFDFVWPPFEDVAEDRQIIPSVLIERLIEKRVANSARRALDLTTAFNCPVHAFAPPPPFLELDDKATLPSAFRPLLDAGVAPAHLRRKLYSVQCAVMTRIYAKHGITLIPAPAAARDEEGFLLRHLWNRDPTHGNRTYGELVVDYLKDYLNG